MKIDGTGGGSSNVAVNDSSMSLNGGAGTNGVSGPSGNVEVDLMRDVIANNVGAGVQANISGGGTVNGDGRPVDVVEQRHRVGGAQRRVPAQLQEQPGDRPRRHRSFRPSRPQ